MASSNRGRASASASSIAPIRPASRRAFVALTLAAVLATAAQPRTGCAAVDMTGDWYAAADSSFPASAVRFLADGILAHSFATPRRARSKPRERSTRRPAHSCSPSSFMGCPGLRRALPGPDRSEPGTPSSPPAASSHIAGLPFSISCACGVSRPTELRGSRSPCGNTNVDAGEQCDDGNLGRGGDCCALDCTIRPDGPSCCRRPVLQRPGDHLPEPAYARPGRRHALPLQPGEPHLRERLSVRAVDLPHGGQIPPAGAARRRRQQGSARLALDAGSVDEPDGVRRPASGTDYALCVFEGASPAADRASHRPASGTRGGPPARRATGTRMPARPPPASRRSRSRAAR